MQYQGQISDGQMHGKGKLVYENGEYYSGEWVKGKRHGIGEYVYSDGSKYSGMWDSDKVHGEGTSWYTNGNRYEGNWVNGKINGRGTLFLNNGDKYEAVKSIMILIGLPYCYELLKWIIFGKPDYLKEDHLVIIKLMGELCELREKDFEEITNEADNNKKMNDYLRLSSLLFKNVQDMGQGWKKMLGQIIVNEKA